MGFIVAFLGVALTEGILLRSVRRTLKSTEKLSAVEALTGAEHFAPEQLPPQVRWMLLDRAA